MFLLAIRKSENLGPMLRIYFLLWGVFLLTPLISFWFFLLAYFIALIAFFRVFYDFCKLDSDVVFINELTAFLMLSKERPFLYSLFFIVIMTMALAACCGLVLYLGLSDKLDASEIKEEFWGLYGSLLLFVVFMQSFLNFAALQLCCSRFIVQSRIKVYGEDASAGE